MAITETRRAFCKLNIITILLLFILILAGGVVRSTGSGMGCPDWPKCFGRYIPPVNGSELPADYKEKYVAGRMVKNQRFAKTLDMFGYGDLASKIRGDRSILIPEEFNAAKTWTEYINRLIGAVSGVFLLLTAIYSFSWLSVNKSIPVLSILNVVLVVIQAWLGSVVVSTNLVAWIVTVHMLLALAILAISIATYHMARVYAKPKLGIQIPVLIVTIIVLMLSIIQITFGTEVREKVDAVAGHLQGGYREDWITNTGHIFYRHRDLALLVLLFNIILYLLVRLKFSRHSLQQQIMSFTFLVLAMQIVTGIVLSYWSLPPFAQAAHIELASILFGAQFYLLLNLFRTFKPRGVFK